MSPFDNTLYLLFALFLVLLNGFFVAAEFAIVKLRHTRVKELGRLHGLRGKLLVRVHAKLDAYLSACQLGITLASLGLGWVGEPAFAQLLEVPLAALGLEDPETVHAIAFTAAFATISYLHIVVGELAPKSAALRRPEVISLWSAVPLFTFYWLMYPFIWLLNASANSVLRRFGFHTQPGQDHEVPYTLDELRVIVHLSHAAPDSEAPASELGRMLAHALEMPQLHVSDVMRTRRELVCIGSDDEAATVRRLLQRHGYSRYAYVDAQDGAILGVLHYKDIAFERAGADYAARLRRHLRVAERVREDTPIATLLRVFRLGAPHLALVEGGDGGVIGFLTMEDILEAILGDIRDEHEPDRIRHASREPLRLEDNSVLVRGDTPLFLLERELGMEIPESATINTVAGLLMERAGHMPRAGESVDLGRYRAVVLRAKGATIESVRLVEMEAGDAASPDL